MNEVILSDHLEHDDFESKKEMEVFNSILFELDPSANANIFEDIFAGFFGSNERPEPIWENTLHENIFGRLHPSLERQVVFGLGKGAYEKYKVLKYTADFYDRNNKEIFEIDGESHKGKLQKLKDEKRDLILNIEFGIETIRLSNEYVEELLLERIRKMKVVDRFGAI